MTEQAKPTGPQAPSFYPYGPHREKQDLLLRLARAPLNILLAGETGTGKEVMAHRLHDLSGRTGPFVAVNCGAITSGLIESELFGHRKGAFTGATRDHTGYIEQAQGGTLFLDEITEMSMEAQTRFLRALQECEITRVGDTRVIPVDLRVISASNRDPVQAVRRGKLREDLYFRLKDAQFGLPPLRTRSEEIVPLAEFFAAREAQEHGGAAVTLTPDAREYLRARRWEGNIRQLRSEIRLAFHLNAAPGETCELTAPKLREAFMVCGSGSAPRLRVEDDEIVRTLSQKTAPEIRKLSNLGLEAAISRVMHEHGGVVTDAMEALRLPVRKFYRLLKQKGKTVEQFRRTGGRDDGRHPSTPPPASAPSPAPVVVRRPSSVPPPGFSPTGAGSR